MSERGEAKAPRARPRAIEAADARFDMNHLEHKEAAR